MTEELKTRFPNYDFDNDTYIGYWFYSHFAYRAAPLPNPEYIGQHLDDLLKLPNHNYSQLSMYLLMDSYYSVIESIELREARVAARKAQRGSTIAIVIAIITLVVTTLIELF